MRLGGGSYYVNRKWQQERMEGAEAESRLQYPYFNVGVCNNPKFDKRWKGGEDGFSVSTDQKFIMVCDGVGGWVKKRVDPGKYAKYLANKVREFFENEPKRDLKDMLVNAVKVNPNRGSTTAVIAKLDSQSVEPVVMSTCNLGDSGYLVVRPTEKGDQVSKVFRSVEHQHYFNCPHQCGENHELPYNAVDAKHDLAHNDIIVMGSDGVFDNLEDDMIIKECLLPNLKSGGNIKNIESTAGCISAYAEFMSYDPNYESPFCRSAVEHGKKKDRYMGGKEDDITVIVAQIKARD